MRRAAGALVPLEVAILDVLLELQRSRVEAAHGYGIAHAVQRQTGARRLTAYGTLYKALERLERAGFVESRWEDPEVAAEGGRPRRRYYRITFEGATAHATAAARAPSRVDGRVAARRTEAPIT